MERILIRYALRNKHTQALHFKAYYLEQIEESGIGGLLDIENYTVISRDLFSGLHDKKGAKIFEGDVLNWDYCGSTEYAEWMKNPVYKVIYKAGYFCAIGIHKELFCHAFRFKYCEITGNIHDDETA